jgi:hypothetical protein
MTDPLHAVHDPDHDLLEVARAEAGTDTRRTT